MAQALIGLLKIALVLGLVVAWGFVLLPPLLRFFSGFGRGANSFQRFNGSMSRVGRSSSSSLVPSFSSVNNPVLGGSGVTNMGGGAGASRACSPAAKKRRREILVGLMVAKAVTFLASLAIGGKAWLLFVVSAGLFGGYVYLLWSANQARLAMRHKVTYLPQLRESVTVEVPDERVHAVSR